MLNAEQQDCANWHILEDDYVADSVHDANCLVVHTIRTVC